MTLCPNKLNSWEWRKPRVPSSFPVCIWRGDDVHAICLCCWSCEFEPKPNRRQTSTSRLAFILGESTFSFPAKDDRHAVLVNQRKCWGTFRCRRIDNRIYGNVSLCRSSTKPLCLFVFLCAYLSLSVDFIFLFF